MHKTRIDAISKFLLELRQKTRLLIHIWNFKKRRLNQFRIIWWFKDLHTNRIFIAGSSNIDYFTVSSLHSTKTAMASNSEVRK